MDLIQCASCHVAAFAPSNVYRPAQANEFYLLMEEGFRGKQTEFAFQHDDDMPNGCPVVILQKVQPCNCDKYSVCTECGVIHDPAGSHHEFEIDLGCPHYGPSRKQVNETAIAGA